MPALLALLVTSVQADDPPFTPPPKYTAKIDFLLGFVWIKGEKYKIQFNRGPKGGILDDGENYVTWNDFRKQVTREPSGLALLRKQWTAAGKEEREKVESRLADWAFNPIMHEWVEVDGKTYARSDGAKIAGKETDLIEGKGVKIWRMKGAHVVLKIEVPGVRYEANKIEEGIDIPDDVFKAPEGLAEKKSESEISDVQSAGELRKKLLR
jgi:hypothetical protein